MMEPMSTINKLLLSHQLNRERKGGTGKKGHCRQRCICDSLWDGAECCRRETAIGKSYAGPKKREGIGGGEVKWVVCL